MNETHIYSYAVTDKLRIYDRGVLVAEFPPQKYPAMIEHMAYGLFGKVRDDT